MRAAAFLLVLLLSGPAWADGLKLLPVDQAERDPAFQAFRDALLEAVRQRDLASVVAAADPEIKLSFGGSYGRETFRDWLIADDDGGGGSYWAELEQALALGGVFDGADHFCTPYTSCYEPEACPGCDPFETLIAVSDRAPVYDTPIAEGEPVAYLSYDVVTLVDHHDHYPWFKVQLPDSGTGFVTGPQVRSPVGYRAYFERRDGAWQMTIFIAGD